MEWTEVVSQALPALAAIFGGVVTGGFQYLNRNGDRKHERQLKKDEHVQEEMRTSKERAYAHIERQEEAVKQFLYTLREQQSAVAEARTSIREGQPQGGESSVDERIREDEATWTVAYIGRGKAIQAWDTLELVATDKKLKQASAAIGEALRQKHIYTVTDIFPAADLGSNLPSPHFENLLDNLREATAKLRLPTNVENQEEK